MEPFLYKYMTTQKQPITVASVVIITEKTKQFWVTGLYKPAYNMKQFNNNFKNIFEMIESLEKLHYIVSELNVSSADHSRNLNVTDLQDLYFQSSFITLINKTAHGSRNICYIHWPDFAQEFDEHGIQSGSFKTEVSDNFPMFTLIKTIEKNSSTRATVAKRSYNEKNTNTFHQVCYTLRKPITLMIILSFLFLLLFLTQHSPKQLEIFNRKTWTILG